MKLHADNEDSLEPCKHMESMLNRTADGTAPWLMRWYATKHAAGCSRCGRFLSRVTSLLTQLKGMRHEAPSETLSEDRWQQLEESWAEVEK